MAFGTINNNLANAVNNAAAGVDDSKITRKAIVEKANAILNSLLATMGSTYNSENSYSDFAINQKALAFEAARILVTSEDVYNDLIFTSTRPEFFYQNIETFLFLNQSFPFLNKDDVAIRSFLLALVKAYFNGARKKSIEVALSLAVENQAEFVLNENFLDGRKNPALDWVPLSHTFRADVFLRNSAIDVLQLQNNIMFLVGLIKPAHTYLELRFIFEEDGDGFTGVPCTVKTDEDGHPLITPDGFEVVVKNKQNQICDTFNMKIFYYQYEDFRHDCEANLNIPVQGELADIIASNKIKTRFGPIGDGAGHLLTDVNQVQVYVNNVQVTVIGVDALKGIITLAAPIPDGAVVTVFYYYLKKHFEVITTNNVDLLLNQFESFNDSLPSFEFSSVLWGPVIETPPETKHIQCEYRYKGFDALNSSLFNDPTTLVFNKVSARDKMNDAWVFKSAGYDLGQYVVTLNYPTPLFVTRQEKTLKFSDPSKSIFYLNDMMSKLNSLVYNIFGSLTFSSLHPEEIQKVYAGLEIESNCDGTQTDKLRSICEGALGILFDFSSDYSEDTYKGIAPDVTPDSGFLINSTSGYVLNDFVLYYPFSGYSGMENVSYMTWNLHDYEHELFVNPISEVFGEVTDITWFENDFKCNNSPNYLYNNIDGNVIGDTTYPLPALPHFKIDDEMYMDYVMGLQDDTFHKFNKFILNSFTSMLNTLDSCSFIGVRPMSTVCDNTYISDWLRVSVLATPVTGFTGSEAYGDLGNPLVPFLDTFNYVYIEPDFTVSGFYNLVNATAFDITAQDQVSGFTGDEIESMAITKTFQDGFFHGYAVLYPYFLANFTPIFDHWWSTSIVFGGSGVSGASGYGTALMEYVPTPVDTSYDILLA